MHMAWVRQVCGRIKSDYRYSNKLVYNNFPWPEAIKEKERGAVEQAAQEVLEIRKQFPGTTLADLYDPLAAPPALVKAHAILDRAVDLCYRPQPFETDRQRSSTSSRSMKGSPHHSLPLQNALTESPGLAYPLPRVR